MNVGNALKVTCVGFAVGVVLRAIQMLYCYDYDTGFYTDGGVMAACCLVFVLLVSVLGGVMCFRSRRYFGPYEHRKNLGLGVTAVLSGVVLLISAAVQGKDYLSFQHGAVSAFDSAEWGFLHLGFLAASAVFGAVQIYMAVGFFRGKNNLEKVPLLYLASVVWAILYLVMVYVFYAKSSSFAENVFAVTGGASSLLCLFYLCKLFAGVDPASAARRAFTAGIFSVVITVTYSFANLALLLLGKSYRGEIPAMIQLDSLGIALFQLTFLVTFRKYSLRRTPRAETGEFAPVDPDKPQHRSRGGRRFRPN